MFGNKKPKPVPLRLVPVSETLTLQSLHGYWIIRQQVKKSTRLHTYATLSQCLKEALKLDPTLCMFELLTLVRASGYALKKELDNAV